MDKTINATIREPGWGFAIDLTGRVPVKAACFTLAAQLCGYRESASARWNIEVIGTTVRLQLGDRESFGHARAAIERACTALHYSVNQ